MMWFRSLLRITIVSLLLAGCASVPLDQPKTASTALEETDDTFLADISTSWRASDPAVDSFYPLVSGQDAFGARLALIDKAERSIDAQYFLMKPDNAGTVFARNLYAAADRGVRVRLLLDDIFTTVDDRALVLLDRHPNIELRIFNPIARNGVYAFNYVGHFRLANRRMHNKSFTVDNQVSIVGGRNIAEEYFQLDTTGEFIDFDMLLSGPIVPDVSASFDRYWNHELAIPMEAFYGHYDDDDLREVRDHALAVMREVGDSIYADATHTQLISHMFDQRVLPYISDAEMIVDDPEKLTQEVAVEQQIVVTRIAQAINEAETEVIVFTPYFIPGERGMKLIRQVRERGVRIVLMTNSLATNNHTAVHSAYSGYRRDLLEAGVELWEARADAAAIVLEDGSLEHDHLTLHTKGLIIDRKHTFVGSLNLDPRSIDINTEMGVMIESEAMAESLAELAMERIPRIAYRLHLDERERIRWHAEIDGNEVVETKEPLASTWRRFQAWLLKIAPESQL